MRDDDFDDFDSINTLELAVNIEDTDGIIAI